jgi:FAD/FMN-containing dehydrogenase
VSWLGRKHGLAANSVLAIEVVTADGRLRRVDHENDPDLFWALRGGGGSFGVVTAMEIALHPYPRSTRARCGGRGSAPPRSCTRGACGR